MSSGHTNRGRNNGSNNRRARRPLSHQRNQQNQSVLQHRTEAAPASASARISEITASPGQEGVLPIYDDQSDQLAPQVEPSFESSATVLGAPNDPTGEEEEQLELGGNPNRPEASSGQLRPNRRSPQLIPSTPSGQIPAGRGPALHSIRAPFAPGQNHVHPAGNLGGSVPEAGADTTSADRSDNYDPPRKHGEGKVQLADQPYHMPRSEPGARGSTPLGEPDPPTWRPPLPQQANDDHRDLWPRRVLPRRNEQSPRDERPVVWSRQEQGENESASFEGRDVRGDIGELVDSLHELFERDRGIASQSDASRCGICYLHFSVSELQYREEEGFYVCPSCARALAHTRIPMVRRQQHS